MSRARFLLIATRLSTSQPASLFGGVGTDTYCDPYQSPFSTAPLTCTTANTFTNFNVLISGVAQFQQNLNYRFESFLYENHSSNALNGGLSLQLSSGLIDEVAYGNGYGYVYVDLSRKDSQASDDVSRSIQIIGTNASTLDVSLICFIGYERQITVSTSTGALII